MATKRLIDCNFLNASGFTKLSNKAKLLYYSMLTIADDRGFVENTYDIIDKLTFNDDTKGNINLELLNNDYISALIELINRGLLYEFKDKYGNATHLIRHWFIHNKLIKGLWTNHLTILRKVEVIDNEYQLKEKETIIKENKNTIKQNNSTIDSNNNELDDEWKDIEKSLEGENKQ